MAIAAHQHVRVIYSPFSISVLLLLRTFCLWMRLCVPDSAHWKDNVGFCCLNWNKWLWPRKYFSVSAIMINALVHFFLWKPPIYASAVITYLPRRTKSRVPFMAWTIFCISSWVVLQNNSLLMHVVVNFKNMKAKCEAEPYAEQLHSFTNTNNSCQLLDVSYTSPTSVSRNYQAFGNWCSCFWSDRVL